MLAAPPVAPINSAPVNPLEFPGQGAVGPTPGGPGGFPLFTPALQLPIVSGSQSTPQTNGDNNGTNGTPGGGPGNSEENENSGQDGD